MKKAVLCSVCKPEDLPLIEDSCSIQPDTARISPFTFPSNLSSPFMENYSGGILFEASSSYMEIMSIFPVSFSLGLFYGLHNHSDRHLLFYYLKKTIKLHVLEKSHRVN